MDINLTGVWERNITGQGVTVVVVDDGVEHTHQDIQANYVSYCQPLTFVLFSQLNFYGKCLSQIKETVWLLLHYATFCPISRFLYHNQLASTLEKKMLYLSFLWADRGLHLWKLINVPHPE